MLPTPRLLALALPGALLLGFAAESALWLLSALAYLFALAGLVGLDWRRTPAPASLRVERRVEQRLSLGAANHVVVHLANHSRFPLHVVVRDEPPAGVVSAGESGRVKLGPGGAGTLRYVVQPPRRGDMRFGRVNVRYPGLLGLVTRQSSYALEQEVKVYPNLRDVRAYELAARSGLLREAGLRRVRRLGAGSEFERLRDYHPDDEYRRIDWAATARRGRPITVDYQIERAQNVLVVLDVGRLMAAPVGFLSKLDCAVNTALLLSYVCLRQGDNVGLLAFADRVVSYISPRGGTGQFDRLLETLYNVRVVPVEPDYTRAFNEVALRARRRSLVVMFTDVADPGASRLLNAALARAATRHLPICATLRDPVVAAYATAPALDSDAVYRRVAALSLLEARAATLRLLAARGVITLDVPADRLSPAVIDKYLAIKARGRL
ncbi:MAG: DUF58 domain-containing protein [Chloroflexota bacterium]